MLFYNLFRYPNGNNPPIKQRNFNFKYHGFSGICIGKKFIFPGFFIGLFFIPIKEPNKTKGVEQQSQSNNNENISVIFN